MVANHIFYNYNYIFICRNYNSYGRLKELINLKDLAYVNITWDYLGEEDIECKYQYTYWIHPQVYKELVMSLHSIEMVAPDNDDDIDEWLETYEQFFAGYPGVGPDAYRPLGSEDVDPKKPPKNNDGRTMCWKCGKDTIKVEGFSKWYDYCPHCGI